MAETLPTFLEPRWFACHTKPRCEKKFAALLTVEHATQEFLIIGLFEKADVRSFPKFWFSQVTSQAREINSAQELVFISQ